MFMTIVMIFFFAIKWIPIEMEQLTLSALKSVEQNFKVDSRLKLNYPWKVRPKRYAKYDNWIFNYRI